MRLFSKLIHSTAVFILDWPVAEHNLQLDNLCKKIPAGFRYEISVLLVEKMWICHISVQATTQAKAKLQS